jgi:phosphoribosylanthranilate isomerase
MTWIKICGITNLEDALTAVDAGADALGFVFYAKSPRQIDPAKAGEIVAALPASVEKVGVFVLHESNKAVQIAEQTGLTSLQLHLQPHAPAPPSQDSGLRAVSSGRSRNGQPMKMYLSVPAAWLLGDGRAAANLAAFIENQPERPFDAIFLDSGTPEQPGGTGEPFDWQQAAPLFEKMGTGVHVVAAGGLTPANVAVAIGILKPWGVDVSSGVEAGPGKKNPEKIQAFVGAVRRADQGH